MRDSSGDLVRRREDTIRARIDRRRGEIETAILDNIGSDGGPTEGHDPEPAEGPPVTLDYFLAAIESAEANPPPIPTMLGAQARAAARSQISLDTLLRRSFASYTLLSDLLIEEFEASDLRREVNLQRLLRLLAAGFDRLLVAVSEEYRKEERSRLRSTGQRRVDLIERMLAGEPLDPPELNYDFSDHHLAVVANGLGVEEAMRDLASFLERRLLMITREDGTVWAWLGGRNPVDYAVTKWRLPTICPPDGRLGVGEPACGLGGWRTTHRQASAAHSIALHGTQQLVRYADVALLALVMQDDLLATSLRELFLAPLEGQHPKSEVLLRTLEAYFSSQRNISSTASVLGIKRETVSNRLRTVETLIGRSIASCGVELESVLRLEKVTGGQNSRLHA